MTVFHQLLSWILAATLVALALPGVSAVADTPDGASVSVLAWHDLPREDKRSRELSGLAWDASTDTLYAITDDAPRIVPISFSHDFSSMTFGDEIEVNVPGSWDGEGIARTATGFFISNENGPHLYELNQRGQVVSEIHLPDHFGRARSNQSLESVTTTDDGHYLFTANEQALDGDGLRSTSEEGTLVRIMRHDRDTQHAQEWPYRTEPVFAAGEGGDTGIADLAALSPSDILVLERSFVPKVGNAARVFRVALDEGMNVAEMDMLWPEIPVAPKRLVVDLATLPDADFPPTLEPQPNRILDNYEGMALGPVLSDGRRVLFLVSDDNKRPTQIPRLLVLAVEGL